MKYRAYQIDLGRQVETPEFVMKWLPRHAEWGYNVLALYLEDAFRFPSHPEFAQKKAWTPAQLKRVVRCATQNGISVIPMIPALGHTAYFLKHPKYRHLSEKRETLGEDGLPVVAGQVCPSLDETHAFLADLFTDIAPYCTAGLLHVSLDESLDLGVCSICRERAAKHGHAALFLDHLKRLRQSVSKLGLRTAIWADMLYYFPEIINDIPKDVAMFDWYYYPFDRFPRVELFNFREVDSAGKLVKAGLETWGCPNNGPFFCEVAPPFIDRLKNIESWWRYGNQVGTEGMCVTSWSPVFAGAELNCLVDAAAADLWLNPGTPDYRRMMQNGLARMYGKKGAPALPAIELMEANQLCGYWRYQIVRAPLNRTATLSDPATFAPTVRRFAAVSAKAKRDKIPPALLNTLTLRDYYIAREQLSRGGSQLLLDARKALQGKKPTALAASLKQIGTLLAGCQVKATASAKATQALWKSTRYVSEPNPLLDLIRKDQKTFRGLGRFLAKAKTNPESVFASCDLLGRRQLLVTVRNRKPCLQGLQVQVSADGKEFKVVNTLWLLEFAADAGEPDTHFIRTHTMALPDDLPADQPLQIRFKATGIGEVDIQKPVIVDGVKLRKAQRVIAKMGRTQNPKALTAGDWVTLGAKAPTKGFPTPAAFAEDHWITAEF